MLQLGINTCFAAKRWPEPRAWADIVASDLGLATVQFSLDLLDPFSSAACQEEYCAEAKRAALEKGLRVHSTFSGLAAYATNLLLHPMLGQRLSALSWYERAIRLSAMTGAEGTGGHVGALSVADFGDSRRRDYLLDFLYEALAYLSGRAKQAGLQYLLWEPMPLLREAPATIRQALDMHDRANRHAAVPIRFCIDVGHQCTGGADGQDRDPYEWLRQVGSLCTCIHLQQTDGIGDRHWPFTESFNRQGIIHPDKVLQALHAGGARDAVLLFEIIHAFEADEAQVVEDLRQSVEYWRPHL